MPQRFFADYEILGELGRGGMGVVYRARQVSLNRPVALKMIAAGQLAAPAQVQRFQLEAEAAGRLDHPNIVPIYEVGEHQGQHFYSMKLITGGSLAEGRWKRGDVPAESGEGRGEREASTAPEETLRSSALVLLKVARAVHYAHQRGVLHRDLKPGNILLDGDGQPHITDFGVAKLVEADSSLTQTNAVLGTPAYMAPELASGKAAQATTAADIYSLGAILYELLAGQPPFVADNVQALLRRIVEQEPLPPSQCVRSGGAVAEASRAVGAHSLSFVPLSADLEIVCLKCLEKETSRRYASAGALADDLERWLRDEPIQARPATTPEKIRRWCRRQPALAGVSFALTVAVLGGLCATSVLFWREREARRRASAAVGAQQILRAQAEAERQTARTEADKSRQLAQFLQEMLLRVGPSAARGRDTTLLREMLDHTAKRLDRELTNQPAVAAELRDTVGSVYHDVGLFSQAIDMHREALRLRRQLHADPNAEVARTLHRLASALSAHGDLDEAEALNQEARAIWERLFGPGDYRVADSLLSLGTIWFQRNDPARAQPLFEQALAIYRQQNHANTAAALHNLANALTAQREYPRAEKLYREAIELARERYGQTNTITALYLSNLGELMRRQNRLAESDALQGEALAVRASLLDEFHPQLADSLEHVGQLKLQQRQLAAAESLYRTALAARRKQAPNDPRKWEDDANVLSDLLSQLGKFDETERLLTDLLGATSATDPRTARLLAIRGSARARHGQWRSAATDLAQAVELEPGNHWHSYLLAPLLVESGDHQAYDSFCRDSLARFAPTNHPDIAVRMALACLLTASPGANLEAVHELLDTALSNPRYSGKVYAAGPKALADYRSGRSKQAIARLEELRKQLENGRTQVSRFVPIQAHTVLAMAHQALGHRDEARSILARAVLIAPAKIAPPTNGDYGNWHEWLILNIILREAQGLIEGAPDTPSSPAPPQ